LVISFTNLFSLGQPKYCVDISLISVKNELTKEEVYRLSESAKKCKDFDFFQKVQNYLDLSELEKLEVDDPIGCEICKSPFEDLHSIVLGNLKWRIFLIIKMILTSKIA